MLESGTITTRGADVKRALFLIAGILVAVAGLFYLAGKVVWGAGPNLITNPSVETAASSTTPQAWANGKWGTNTTTFSYPSTGHTGTRSVKAQITSYSSGDAKWYFNAVTIKPNTAYTFSDFYQANVQTRVVLEYTTSANALTYVELSAVAPSTPWAQATRQFTTPANVQKLTVYHLISSVGSLTLDDASLTEDNVAPAPTVSFTAPANNATVSGAAVALTVNTTNTVGVQYKVDNTNSGAEVTTSPFGKTIDTTGLTNGNHTIAAVARNSANQTVTATITVNVQNLPTVSFTAPAANATVSGSAVALSANATNAAGVLFKLDNTTTIGSEDTTAPYGVTWDASVVPNGQHTLSAIARNAANQTTTATVTVTVQNVVVTNLVPNPSLETSANTTTPDSWVNNVWGTNTPAFAYLPTGHTGAHSVQVKFTSYTDGDAKWYFNPIDVTPQAFYSYSDYYQSDRATDVVVQFTNTDGTVTYQTIGTAAASPGVWRQAAYSFSVPATANKLTVMHIIAGVGTLTLDDASVVLDSPPNTSANPIPNPSVEINPASNPAAPLGWVTNKWGTNTAQFDYIKNDGHDGSRSVKVTLSNYTDGDGKWYFAPQALQKGSQYRFTTWYKTNTQPHAVVMFTRADGTQQFLGLPNPLPPAGSDTTWQKYSDTFTVPDTAVTTTVFMFITNNGWVQVDDQKIEPYTPVGFTRPLMTLYFDDSEEDNVTTVLPVLQQHGYKSTMCFATTFIENTPANQTNVTTIKNDGQEICAHTVTHPFLTQITATQLTTELQHSQQYLQSLTGKPVDNFASPYGDYNTNVINEIKKYYRSHRTVDEGYNSKDNFDAYRLRVQNMQSTTTIGTYQSWLDQAKATNTWLIIVYHRVATDPDQFDTTPTNFAQQMTALQNSGITVKTAEDALNEVTPQL
jgi:peptidoglycan/xylan/chitin deacetylase (PgdA/CDA1 family)